MKDYYKILGVQKNAPIEDIKKNYLRLAQIYHPDKNGGDGEKFKEVNEAYQILSDYWKRQDYDHQNASRTSQQSTRTESKSNQQTHAKNQEHVGQTTTKHMLITVKDLIQKSFELYQKNYQLFLKYMLLLFIPTGIITIAGVIIGSFLATVAVFGFTVPVIIYLLIIITGAVVSLWISLAFVRVMAARYENKEAQPEKMELQNATGLIWPALLASLLTTLVITGGLVLLIIPGIIFTIWFAFSFYAIALDNNKVVESLKISKRLVRGRWWAVWWRLFAPTMVFAFFLILVQWLIGIPLGIILRNVPEGTLPYVLLTVFFTLLSTFVSILFTPLTTAAPTILYLELKKTPVTAEKNAEPPQT